MTPRSDPRINKLDLWKHVFYRCKTQLLQLPGHPKPSKKQLTYSTDNFATQNQANSRKCVKIGSHQGLENPSKIMKNRYLCHQVTSCPPLGVPGWAKCRSRCKNDPERYEKWTPKHTFGHHHFNGNLGGDRRQRRSLKILIHNWTSKQICSIRYTQYLYV